jgi:hypothetical protein
MTLVYGVIKMEGAIFRVCITNFLSWVAWFTFLLYDTDWFGRHIYGGDPSDAAGPELNALYQAVRYLLPADPACSWLSACV